MLIILVWMGIWNVSQITHAINCIITIPSSNYHGWHVIIVSNREKKDSFQFFYQKGLRLSARTSFFYWRTANLNRGFIAYIAQMNKKGKSHSNRVSNKLHFIWCNECGICSRRIILMTTYVQSKLDTILSNCLFFKQNGIGAKSFS